MPFLLIMPSSFNAAAAVFEIVPNFRTFKCRSSRPVVLVGIDDELVVDGNHLGRSILLDTVELHLHATQIEFQHRRHRSMPLIMQAAIEARNSSAGLKRRPAIDLRVEDDLGHFRGGNAAVRIDPSGADAVFEHWFHLGSQSAGKVFRFRQATRRRVHWAQSRIESKNARFPQSGNSKQTPHLYPRELRANP
jgi:hypothetical protein